MLLDDNGVSKIVFEECKTEGQTGVLLSVTVGITQMCSTDIKSESCTLLSHF